jgi:hypothetical protein
LHGTELALREGRLLVTRQLAAVLATILLALQIAPIVCYDACANGVVAATSGCQHPPEDVTAVMTTADACMRVVAVEPASIITPYRLQQRAPVPALPFNVTLEGAAAFVDPLRSDTSSVIPPPLPHAVLRI